MCAHTHINSCGFATAAIYVVWSVPPQSFMPSPSSFSETVSAGVPEMPAIHEWGLATCFLIALLTADGWFFYYQKFKKQKDLAVAWLGVKES